jgi:citrate synthase
MTDLLTAAEAARRLGVKPATLYAYVSRGTLNRKRAADGRTSLFDAGEVERLARRGRPRRPAGALDITVESKITEISGDRVRYRGRDAIELAEAVSFEGVAQLLWTGSLPDARVPDWRATATALATGRAVQAALPRDILPLERMQVIVPAMAVTDPLRLQLDRPAVIAAGRAIIAGTVDCLPGAGREPGDRWAGDRAGREPGDRGAGDRGAGDRAGPEPGGVAGRLWPRLCERRPSRPQLRAMSAALVLLADHELAASTLAARTAASARADPYAVVSAGLGAMSGTLHGGASRAVEILLSDAHDPAEAPRVIAEVLRRGEHVPGFGHKVYKGEDPRGRLLLDLVRRAAPKSRQLAVTDAVIAEVGRRSLPALNIDLALGTFVTAADLTRGAGEAIFAVARIAGWIAHALEAYETGTILRPRASYTGPQ